MRAEKWPLDAPIWKSLMMLTGTISVSGVRTKLYFSKEPCMRSENGCHVFSPKTILMYFLVKMSRETGQMVLAGRSR